MSETRNCLYCGEVLKGRIDKKFCDDQCRTSYNNRANGPTINLVRNINSILRRNRKIMEDMIPVEGKIRVPASKLKDKGFSFSYHTHIYTTKTGNTYYFCYEFGYMPLEGDYYMVVRKDSGKE